MADIDLPALRAAESKATPGPWDLKDRPSYCPEGRCGGIVAGVRTEEEWDDRVEIVTTDSGVYGPSAADAEFIVAARNAFPALLDRIEAAEAALAYATRVAQEACGWPGHGAPSEGHTWVEELAGFLRVMQGQRDDAWDRERAAEAEVSRLRAEVERLRAEREGMHARFLDWRGVEPEDACQTCGGSGARSYPSSAAWRGGIGGQVITRAVCDKCWGSGSKARPWLSHRRALDLQARADAAWRAVEAARALVDSEPDHEEYGVLRVDDELFKALRAALPPPTAPAGTNEET